MNLIPIVYNQCDYSDHFERSEVEWRNLFIRFLHFGPLCGPTVEMTKTQIIITIGIIFP